jgi:hypothetical protein
MTQLEPKVMRMREEPFRGIQDMVQIERERRKERRRERSTSKSRLDQA